VRNASVADLKDHLSSYLRQVRAGEEILICDRRRPVAKLVPLTTAGEANAEELALAAAGALRLPEQDLPDSYWDSPAPSVPLRRAVQAIRADRDST